MAGAVRAARNPLFQDLPAVFTDPGWVELTRSAPEENDYAGWLLDAFRRVFLVYEGASADATVGRIPLEASIAALPRVADPTGKPAEFLDWLGQWVALSDEIELPLSKKESLIRNALRLYRIRGTRRYLEEMLGYYLDGAATVDEPDFPSIQIGRSSRVGVDTCIGGPPAHFFRVTLVAAAAGPEGYARLVSLATAVIDLSKPAHTWYELRIDAPAMQIGIHSTIGVDTLLITRPEERTKHA